MVRRRRFFDHIVSRAPPVLLHSPHRLAAALVATTALAAVGGTIAPPLGQTVAPIVVAQAEVPLPRAHPDRAEGAAAEPAAPPAPELPPEPAITLPQPTLFVTPAYRRLASGDVANATD